MSESESKSEKKAEKLQQKLNRVELISQKAKLEDQLSEIRRNFGMLIENKNEPKINQCRWTHVLNEMQEMQEYMVSRKERFKFRTKKIAEQAIIKREKYFEQIKLREQNEQKQIQKYYERIAKVTFKEFWRSINLVRKQIQQFQQDKEKQENQKQKLDDIVSKLNDVTEEIGKKLENYQTFQEEETSEIPIERYKKLYLNLQKRSQNNYKLRQHREIHKSDIVITLKKVKDEYSYVDSSVEGKRILNADKLIKAIKQVDKFKFLFDKQSQSLDQQPYLLHGTLRSYQLVGMQWMASLHLQKMNGILADEMGLGKTIQTIALLAYLAANKGIWGPHLVIVPTSILVNWEIEFKRWCPAFKIMTYFGSPKERKLKRQGWSQLNQFHICITSYKIVIQDAKVFRRKKWYYMILDEAQHIKNFKSQRWQLLLNFNTKNRLLLTGTPLQNDLGEIWSLLHFLMPSIFDSHQDFLEWFSGPIEKAIQENKTVKEDVLKKLHNILRPFVLRRLKKDVEKQLPQKQEVIIKCQLSRRQKYLYDEFIQSSGNVQINTTDFVAVMNVVQQLRKVCNHPELFEQRPVEQPFLQNAICLSYPKAILMPEKVKYQLDISQTPFRIPTDKAIEAYLELMEFKFKQQKFTKFGQRWEQNKHNQKLQSFKNNLQMNNKKLILYHALLTYNVKLLDFQSDRKSIQQHFPWIKHMQEFDEEYQKMEPVLDEFKCVNRKVNAFPLRLHFSPYLNQPDDYVILQSEGIFKMLQRSRMLFPNKKLLVYDCGKMNTMVSLIHQLKSKGHKIIIFTQMTKMLDIMEAVLSMSKISYLRLDGSTPVEMRQKLVERFNQLPITCFISSTRSGGIGINLTGADTVIFYDTDWNPAMDKQAQDRCHRIGQTRSVTIYRLISTSTIEENILLKAIQKRQLDDFVMQSGMFSAEQIMKQSQLFADDEKVEQAIKQVEDKEDRVAAQQAILEEQNYNLNGIEEIMDIDENQEWMNIKQFPPLMKYGLKMMDIKQQEDDMNSEEDKIEEEEEDESDENDDHQEEKNDEIEEEIEISHDEDSVSNSKMEVEEEVKQNGNSDEKSHDEKSHDEKSKDEKSDGEKSHDKKQSPHQNGDHESISGSPENSKSSIYSD